MNSKRLKKLGQASFGKLALTIFKMFMIWLLAVFVLSLLMEALPGDVASNKVGKQGPEAVAALRKEMGLDKPFMVRFFAWLKSFFASNLGNTLMTKKNVSQIIKTPLISSLSLAGIVFLGLVFISIPLSIYCAYYQNSLARLISRVAVLLSSIPEFVLTILATMILSLKFRLLPVLSIPGPGKTVWQNPVSMVMPSLCLWLICTAAMFRYLKVMIENHAKAAYVREAFLAGLSKRKVLFVHLMPSALPGISQIMASAIPYLLAGSMVVETITAYPGMGYTLIQAVQSRETPIVMAIGSFLIATTIVFYFLADMLGRKTKGEGRVL